MAKKNDNDLKLQDFPEEITEEGLKIYGETSYENQMAVLSQFLHNGGIEGDGIEARGRREEIIAAILSFLEQKKTQDSELNMEPTVEYATIVAESPAQYDLFGDFFNVPFPNPQHGRHTMLQLKLA